MIERNKSPDAQTTKNNIIESLRRELVGPAPGHPCVQLNGEEILRPQDPPRYRYACGILFPNGVAYSGFDKVDRKEHEGISAASSSAPANEGAVAGSDQDEQVFSDATSRPVEPEPETEGEANASSSFLPSTMGISFLADVSGGLRIVAGWGTYELRALKGYPTSAGKNGSDPELWFRRPGSAEKVLTAAELSGVSVVRPRPVISSETMHGKLELDIVSRPWRNGRLRLITVTLVNASEVHTPINEMSFFQCCLNVAPINTSVILPYPDRADKSADDEELSLALLYRQRPIYAIGHGCAADWNLDSGRVLGVRSEVLPVFQQAPVLPRADLDGVKLSMKKFAEGAKAEVVRSCKAMHDQYVAWIDVAEKELAADVTVGENLKSIAAGHFRSCRACAARIAEGVRILETDGDAFHAFRLMNRAMLEQREHYALSSEADKRRTWLKDKDTYRPSAEYKRPSYPETTVWRPFQLAFVLMNLRSFVDPACDERRLVDVIWFPTGGGKTEAYLGLAAFSILYRRLHDPSNAGTTVLMRYTLRLLTTQQFQRAASMVCALELIRKGDADNLGKEPITIGLWLGSGVTPNRHEQAVDAFQKLTRGEGANRFVLLSCPWCGVELGPRKFGQSTKVFGYHVVRDSNGRQMFVFRCDDPRCPFSTPAGLPLAVVDEALYAKPPTMLIGTVDKFAMIPWTPEARKLFGIDNAAANSPPDLIIQDELHLISGPLGSMVGHYETLIDDFTTRRLKGGRISAKVVASTATIARAQDQIMSVFGRQSFLFPPPGHLASDSFFAKEGSSDGGRTYVGILATALPSHITAQVWTLSMLLQSPLLVEAPDTAVDPYWTLVAYFNSLRELGRAATLVQADIRERLNAVWDRLGMAKDPQSTVDYRRFINEFEELTSRVRSEEIPDILQKLFNDYPKKDAVDLCYATNMIQVGLDVPRLSMMTIVGQPKGASEYIQASSRVGRGAGKPGLVVTNFNPFKPRDRSHFESFRPFHENAYRHVEATSVTPFAVPVSERAIHAIAVGYIRCRHTALRDSPSIGVSTAIRDEVKQLVRDRIRTVAASEEARAMYLLDRFFDDWTRVCPNIYGDFGGSDEQEPLLWPAGKPVPPSERNNTIRRSTLSSMRNVDADCEASPIKNYTGVGQ